MDNTLLKELRRRAHALKPVVRIGQNGLTDAVVAELDSALAHHELVKIKLAGESAGARREQLTTLCERTESETVQQIGHTATLWRKAPEARKPAVKKPAKSRPRVSGTDRARASSRRTNMRQGTRR